jgi:hypothetical protein
MAKRRTSSKSQEIRKQLLKDPQASPQAIAKDLKVTPGLVYNVRARMDKAAGSPRKASKARKRRPNPKPTVATARVAANGRMKDVLAAAQLIKACGSIEKARQALNEAAMVASALA